MAPGTTKKSTASKPEVARPSFNPPSSTRQVRFYQLLQAARKQWFIDALSEALGQLDQAVIKRQIREFVPEDAQRILATAGIRDEHVFPVPAILEAKPSLVGYYRLLLGVPQKSFYKGSTGMGPFKGMEQSGIISKSIRPRIPGFRQVMAKELAELLRGIPTITERDLRELPLLTFGSQLQGSNNTHIGKIAMRDVFIAVKEIVARYVVSMTESQLTVKNSAGRTVVIALAHDPDVRIQEQVSDKVHQRVAVEVKGGTDVSNVHNRAGEAEKSHQKAKRAGFPEFWTIISKRGSDPLKLRSESPTTNHWFDVAEVLARHGHDWDEFRRRLAGACGIPLADE